ncbi:MAG: putative Ceramide glucosyltransferase [Verrucomicrobiales bacterium]|jgi:ceramide glucosyltransferase|nr:putative Ceramide glucosyltransferase [Verrucomicrobiales bacterium]MDB6129827.1 putative Ceramide glucosyltransferase [Verrucomicrobiales bacterium]
MVPLAFSILAALSIALLLWQWTVAIRFPLREVENLPDFAPAITILKPLKGSDENTRKCLESWFLQEYNAPLQILLGVASEDDSVCDIVRDLISKYPKIDASLIICDPVLGPNAKVSSLCHLSSEIKHDFVAISDADVLAGPNFLRETIPMLKDEQIGLIHSFYELANPTTLAMRYEAITTNADFWSQVLQAASLKPVNFALGASMILRKKQIEELNLFQVLKDYLADDYWMGRKICESGKEVVFSRLPVKCMESKSNWRGVYSHQLRWARTVRVSQPFPYFFSILSNPTLWPVLWYLSASVEQAEHVLHMLLICLLIRISVVNQLQWRFTQSKAHIKYLWLVPIRDILGAFVWLQSFAGNHVVWSGQFYRVGRSGKLVPSK